MILDHHFLIAMPEMADPIFAGTVTYILQHDEEGAFGLIVNRPINLDLESVFHSVDIKNFNKKSGQKPVYHGSKVLFCIDQQSECGIPLCRILSCASPPVRTFCKPLPTVRDRRSFCFVWGIRVGRAVNWSRSLSKTPGSQLPLIRILFLPTMKPKSIGRL